MPVREVTRDQPPRPIAPEDTSVIVPDSVKRASAAADAIHAQAYQTPPAEPATPSPPAPVEGQAVTPQPDPQPAPPPPQPDPRPVEDDTNVSPEQWHHRYLSMQGRFNASQRTVGDLQQQMTELGDELQRTQQMVRARGTTPQPAPAPVPQPATKLLTDKDRENYGDELIDFATRAAREAVAPQMQQLQDENKQLKQRMQGTALDRALGQLTTAVPNWQEVNHDPRFLQWLRSPDLYSGVVRHDLLKSARAAASAPRMIAFFKGFLEATGQPEPAPQPEPSPQTPRQAAVPLVTLAAPGRPRPASGEGSVVPAAKPQYTRANIQKNYDDRRKGLWSTREADWQKLEADMIAAGPEGRVR